MRFLKLSTSATLRIGPFLDDADGKTEENGLTIANTDIKLSKAGAAFGNKNSGGGTVDGTTGWYSITLDTTDLGTIGNLDLYCHISGSLPVWHHFYVLPANVYDSLFATAGTDYLQVDTYQVNATVQTAKDLGALNVTGVNTLAGHDPGATLVKVADLGTVQTGDSYAIVNNGTYGNAAIKGYVDDIGVAGAGLTALGDTRIANLDAAVSSRLAPAGTLATVTNLTNAPTAGDLTATMKTSVNTEIDTALTDIKLDHLIAVAESGDVANSSIIAKLASKSATPAFTSYDNTTDALEAVRDRGDAAWLTATGFATATMLADIHDTDLPAVKTETAAILADTGTDGVVLPQAQADKVWGTTVRALTDKADFALSAASRAAIWDETGGISLSFESLLERAYEILNNKMIVTESSGDVALRNLADSADIATGNVQDLGATTQRNALTWA